MAKYLTFGDIHGRQNWIPFTHGSYSDYDVWKKEIFEGADPLDKKYSAFPYMKYERIIFIGDYVDSFDVDNLTIKHNLLQIIELKRALPERVVLLLGNHDVQYIVPDQECSGYRPEAHHDLSQIFRENEHLFVAAHYEHNTLWTHAGVTTGWLRELRKSLFHPNNRFLAINQELDQNFSSLINAAWQQRDPALFMVDASSGGWSTWGGPLWVRPHGLLAHSIPDLNQVVGHTEMSEVRQEKLTGIGNDYTLTFVDTLPYDTVYEHDLP